MRWEVSRVSSWKLENCGLFKEAWIRKQEISRFESDKSASKQSSNIFPIQTRRMTSFHEPIADTDQLEITSRITQYLFIDFSSFFKFLIHESFQLSKSRYNRE